MLFLNKDIIFKNVFKDDANMKRLLEEALDIKIKNLTQLNTELSIENINEKRKIVDIIAYTDKGVINVEVNNDYKVGLDNRNFLYFCKLIGSHIDKKEDYIKIDDHIQLNITWNLQKYLEEDISNEKKLVYKLKEEKLGFEVNKYFKIMTINMDYYKNKCYNELNKKDLFFKMLAADNLEVMKELSKGDRVMENITKKVEDLNVDYDILNKLYNERDEEMLYRSGMIAAKEEGRQEGIEKGIEKGIRKTACNLLKAGVDIKIIKNTTGLTDEEIAKL